MPRPLALAARPAGLAAAIVLAGSPAAAAEVWAGLYVHDVEDIAIGGYEEGPQVAAGVISAPVERLARIGRPSLQLLGAVNTRGGTNYAAGGLSWRVPLGDRAYLRPGVGLAVHDGEIDLPSPYAPGLTGPQAFARLQRGQHDLDLGSRVLLEADLALGWRVGERLALEATWLHLSHAQLSGRQNPGLSDLGLRLVYRLEPR